MTRRSRVHTQHSVLVATRPIPVPVVHSQPVAQERGQGGVQRLAGAEQGVVDIVPRTAAADFLQIGGQGRQIALAQAPGGCSGVARAVPGPRTASAR